MILHTKATKYVKTRKSCLIRVFLFEIKVGQRTYKMATNWPTLCWPGGATPGSGTLYAYMIFLFSGIYYIKSEPHTSFTAMYIKNAPIFSKSGL